MYECRDSINRELYDSFHKSFQNTLQRFKSLSKSITYKKVQKVNIIKVNNEHDNIINLLNKITMQNFSRIDSKVQLKKTNNNCMSFVNQILGYIEKTDVNNVPLCYRIMKTLFRTSNDHLKAEISARVKEFIQNFIDDIYRYTNVTKTFDIDEEEYTAFVQRNSDNNAIINRMRVISIMLKDAFMYGLTTDMLAIYNTIVEQMESTILSSDVENSVTNNFIFLMFEFVIIIVSDKNFRKKKEQLTDFTTTFNTDIIKKKLTNKNRFKLLDIFDIIDKHQQQ